MFNLRSEFIISDTMWGFLKVILTYCNPLNAPGCLKDEVILIYYLECTNHTQQIFELLLNIGVLFSPLQPVQGWRYCCSCSNPGTDAVRSCTAVFLGDVGCRDCFRHIFMFGQHKLIVHFSPLPCNTR